MLERGVRGSERERERVRDKKIVSVEYFDHQIGVLIIVRWSKVSWFEFFHLFPLQTKKNRKKR